MSESSGGGGKLALLRQASREAVASAPGKTIGLAARQEIQPVLDRLDLMTEALNALPERMETSASGAAIAIREGLAPMVSQVTSLRVSLEALPTLLAQQTDGVLSQIQTENLTMRTQIDGLRSSLAMLPDALAQQVAPIILMAESLDQVLELQRGSLAALHEQSVGIFRTALEPTIERVDSGVRALVKQGHQTASVLKGMKGLPSEIRQATAEAKSAGMATAEAIREAKGSQWHPLAQALVTAVVGAALILGGLAWLGTVDSSRLLRPSAPDAKAQAWDNLYQQAPQWRATMDQFLGASGKK